MPDLTNDDFSAAFDQEDFAIYPYVARCDQETETRVTRIVQIINAVDALLANPDNARFGVFFAKLISCARGALASLDTEVTILCLNQLQKLAKVYIPNRHQVVAFAALVKEVVAITQRPVTFLEFDVNMTYPRTSFRLLDELVNVLDHCCTHSTVFPTLISNAAPALYAIKQQFPTRLTGISLESWKVLLGGGQAYYCGQCSNTDSTHYSMHHVIYSRFMDDEATQMIKINLKGTIGWSATFCALRVAFHHQDWDLFEKILELHSVCGLHVQDLDESPSSSSSSSSSSSKSKKRSQPSIGAPIGVLTAFTDLMTLPFFRQREYRTFKFADFSTAEKEARVRIKKALYRYMGYRVLYQLLQRTREANICNYISFHAKIMISYPELFAVPDQPLFFPTREEFLGFGAGSTDDLVLDYYPVEVRAQYTEKLRLVWARLVKPPKSRSKAEAKSETGTKKKKKKKQQQPEPQQETREEGAAAGDVDYNDVEVVIV